MFAVKSQQTLFNTNFCCQQKLVLNNGVKLSTAIISERHIEEIESVQNNKGKSFPEDTWLVMLSYASIIHQRQNVYVAINTYVFFKR